MKIDVPLQKPMAQRARSAAEVVPNDEVDGVKDVEWGRLNRNETWGLGAASKFDLGLRR
jgi:hypothetical protein